jgi:hypothetical protein
MSEGEYNLLTISVAQEADRQNHAFIVVHAGGLHGHDILLIWR